MNTNDSFSCFYHLTDNSELEKIWKDEKTLFIFDTNVLLSLYSFQSESRRDFFKVLDSIKDRIWIPFHVGLEFQKNRLTIIKNRRKTFNDLSVRVDNLKDTIKFEKKPFTTIQTDFSLKKNYPNVFSKLTENFEKINNQYIKLEKEINELLKEVSNEVSNYDTDKIYVNSHDFIREELSQLFNGDKLGKNIFNSQEKLNILYNEGEERYKNKIPPGYKDESKGNEEFLFDGLTYKRKFGDLIIFKQIIDFSKEKLLKNVIFISEDIKEDWRHIEEQNGDKILGARSELKMELYNESGVNQFLVYQIQDFMKNTKEYLNIQIEDNTLINIKISLDEEKHKKKIEEIKNNSYFVTNDSNLGLTKDNSTYEREYWYNSDEKYSNEQNTATLEEIEHQHINQPEEFCLFSNIEEENEDPLIRIRERRRLQELERLQAHEQQLQKMREHHRLQELEKQQAREQQLKAKRERRLLQELERLQAHEQQLQTMREHRRLQELEKQQAREQQLKAMREHRHLQELEEQNHRLSTSYKQKYDD